VLVGFSIAGAMRAFAAISATEARARHADMLQSLALQKLNELRATEDPNTIDTSGDFSEQGYPAIKWTLTTESTSVENLDTFKITATDRGVSQTLTQLIYVPPETGTSGQ
jgi:hypothetical protein